MASAPDGRLMENRGLLTDDDRRFFQGDKTVSNPDQTRHEKAYNIRQRIQNLATDIDILRNADEDGLVDAFYAETNRNERLRQQLEDLQQKLDADE